MYDYLKQFIKKNSSKSKQGNKFYPVEESEIISAEHWLGYEFPSELKQFYQEIGYGFLTHPKTFGENYSFCNVNRINPPDLIIDMLQNGAESGFIAPDVYEDLEAGDLPVFEIGDSTRFLIMKALSAKHNAVYTVSGIKIEDSFERFIYRLYHENPSYYDDIIEDYYKTKN